MLENDRSIDALLQVVAILIDRLGGEVVISQKEFTAFEDVDVKSRILSNYLVLHLNYEDEGEDSIDPHANDLHNR